jgi:hypothetical protein
MHCKGHADRTDDRLNPGRVVKQNNLIKGGCYIFKRKSWRNSCLLIFSIIQEVLKLFI